jgi:Zn-dependent protease
MQPSPVFLALVAGFAGSCVWAASTDLGNTRSARIPVFAIVLLGWVVSLCLHEYAHALVAYRGGDRSVIDRGYLTLDPRKYTSVGLSLVFPVVMILLGGIGLPGGAVWVHRDAIRTRGLRSAMSLAGPATNLACALAAAVTVKLLGNSAEVLQLGLSYLGFLQITAVLLNMLPIPGLDGFGALEPWLDRSLLEKIAPISQFAVIGVFMLFWYVPAFNEGFFNVADSVFSAIGGNELKSDLGYFLFRFWDN